MFSIKSIHGIQLFVKKCVSLYLGFVNSGLKNIPYLLFCIKFSNGIQLFLDKCVLLHCSVKSAFCQVFTISGWKMFFCIKSSHGILLLLKNVILLYCGLKTAFCQKLSNSCWKMRFASNPLMARHLWQPFFEKCV